MASEVSSTKSYSYLQTSSGRISGLVSGMDTESIVEKLMKAESAQMEKLQQQQTKYEWQRDAYRSVNTKLQTFSDDLFNNYGLQKNFSTKIATVSDSSKVGVTATATATGSLSIDYVKQLATSATTPPQTLVANSNILAQGGTKLSELGINATENYFNFSITKDGVTTEKSVVYSKNDTLDTFVNKLKAEGVDASFKDGILSFGTSDAQVSDANYSKNLMGKMNVQLAADGSITGSSELKGQYTVTSASTLTDIGITTDGTVTMGVLQKDGTMKSIDVKYSATDSISTLVSKLNSTGVTAVFSDGKLSITANNTGSYSGGAIQVRADSNGGNGLFNKLGLINSTNGVGKIADGTDAIYSANGIEMTSKSNTFSVSGYTVTANKTFGYDITTNQKIASEKVSVSANTDVDAMMDKIKSFVNSYNDLITSLNSQTKEKKNLSYQPLTDAQKAEMTTDQIAKWEEKAKAGILRNDTYVTKFVSDSRKSIYEKVGAVSNEAYNTMYKIGITTTDTYADGGKLQIDENKLRKALTTDPDSVMNLFTDSQTGIVKKLRDSAKNTITSIEKQAGKDTSANSSFTIGKRLDELTTKISDWKDRLKDIENHYWSQFTAMEQAIQKANSQSSIFSQG